MRIQCCANLAFKKCPNDIEDYKRTLLEGKKKIGNLGKSLLILPTTALPDEMGLGHLNTKSGMNFINFAKDFWGINEIQLLPTGQFHFYNNKYHTYSGTSMTLGNHIIDIKSFLPKEDYQKLIQSTHNLNEVNYENVITKHSLQEKLLWKLFNNLPENLADEFKNHKFADKEFVERSAIYNVLADKYHTHNFMVWNETDKNLFNDDIIPVEQREKLIDKIHKENKSKIDFYKFKQFLAEKSLENAKNKLNAEGIKLNGDMIINFSNDEIWSYPKAFFLNKKTKWGVTPINLFTEDGQNLLRKKARIFAKRFDGFRVDASWLYSNQKIDNEYFNHHDKYLNMIDEEVKKVKGKDYDLKNIMHEFSASPEDFHSFEGDKLKDFVAKRNSIHTADYLSKQWGTNNNFVKRGWDKTCYVIGMTNHDSVGISQNSEQEEVLSKIFKIPIKKFKNKLEFIKAKFAESFGAYNNMLYVRDVLSLNNDFEKIVIPQDYKKMYFENLEKGMGFNPMDALEKNFKAMGLDKTDKELFNKIVKYNRILQGKNPKTLKIKTLIISLFCLPLVALAVFNFIKNHTKNKAN